MRDAAPPDERPRSSAALAIGYAVVALAAFAPALQGNFVSDDIGYVVGNPWIHTLSIENLRAILDPTGPAAAHTANYAPVHLLMHALSWQLFGANTFGHHVLNVLLHAIASVLLVALFVLVGFRKCAASSRVCDSPCRLSAAMTANRSDASISSTGTSGVKAYR
jgi:hypothetical protein